MSVDGDGKTNETSSVDPSRRRRILVCAQSNSAVDELVARLAGAFGARADRTLVRLGREEVTREDALPFLVTRLVDDRRRAESAEIGRGEARGGGGGGGGASVGNGGPSSADASASATRARLERLGEEIRAEESKESSRFGVSGVSSARGVASVHLDMLHAQRRRLLGELAALKQSEKKKSGVDAFVSGFGGSGVSSGGSSSRGSGSSGGSTWSRVVAGADVVCATLSGAGLLAADHRAKGGSRNQRERRFGGFAPAGATEKDDAAKLCAVPLFDLVIVDEAAQATELATLIPLRWLRPGGVAVLVGDPKQLAPTVLAKSRAVERCLSRSLFERMQRCGAHSFLLSVQYRMHPSIRAFPSNRFYGSRLVDGTNAGSRVSPLGANYAVVDCVCGYEIRRRSVSNPVEVSACVAVYAQLVKNLRRKRKDARDGGASSTTVGVVTPYRDQLDALRRGFLRVTETNPDSSRLAPVEFATVDGVQGREFDVVLFSCVRATATATATASRDGSRTEKASVREKNEKNKQIGFDDDVDDASPADVAAGARLATRDRVPRG
jgi:senataxin